MCENGWRYHSSEEHLSYVPTRVHAVRYAPATLHVDPGGLCLESAERHALYYTLLCVSRE